MKSQKKKTVVNLGEIRKENPLNIPKETVNEKIRKLKEKYYDKSLGKIPEIIPSLFSEGLSGKNAKKISGEIL